MTSLQRTCEVCQREFTAVRSKLKRNIAGKCPYCGTYDNGTANGRLSLEMEYVQCEENDHSWRPYKKPDWLARPERYGSCSRCENCRMIIIEDFSCISVDNRHIVLDGGVYDCQEI